MVEPVYFTSLEVENVRCFGDRQNLNLMRDDRRPARWTLILGDNGVGKTTLLECLAWMRLEPGRYDPVLFNEENDFLIRLRPRIRLGNLGPAADSPKARLERIETNAPAVVSFARERIAPTLAARSGVRRHAAGCAGVLRIAGQESR